MRESLAAGSGPAGTGPQDRASFDGLYATHIQPQEVRAAAASKRGTGALCRKSQTAGAKLSYLGHMLAESRHGMIPNVPVTQAYGRAKRKAVEMAREIPGGRRRATLAANKG